jgi:hypothetical protein
MDLDQITTNDVLLASGLVGGNLFVLVLFSPLVRNWGAREQVAD